MISDEQQVVVDAVADGHNVVVKAVAGAGKSTACFQTVEQILREARPGRAIVVCYNVCLQASSEKRAAELGLTDVVDCFTVHGLATAIFGQLVPDNTTLGRMIDEYDADNSRAVITTDYDICFVDEAQDLTVLMLNVLRVLSNINKNRHMQFVVVGDTEQEIYSFRSARRLDLLDHPYKWIHGASDPCGWVHKRLSTSYRMTKPLCEFINQLFPHCARIVPGNTVDKPRRPRFVVGDTSNGHLRTLIVNLLREYAIGDIMILAPSVRTFVCERLCLQLSADHHIPVFCSAQATTSNYSEIARNKLLFSSFHQSKGQQRKCVVVFGVGTHYQEKWDAEPNPLHVALTRASELLIVFQQHNEGRLSPFEDDAKLRKVCDMSLLAPEMPASRKRPRMSSAAKRHFTADQLTYFAPDECVAMLNNAVIASLPKTVGAAVDVVVQSVYSGEDVQATYEPAIVSAFEYHRSGRSRILIALEKSERTHLLPAFCKTLIHRVVKDTKSEGTVGPIAADEWVTIALSHNAITTGNMHVPHQIKNSWVGEAEHNFFYRCVRNLVAVTENHTKYAFDVEQSRTANTNPPTTVHLTVPYISTEAHRIMPWIFSLGEHVLESHLWQAAMIMWTMHLTAVNVFFVSKNTAVQIRVKSDAVLENLVQALVAAKH